MVECMTVCLDGSYIFYKQFHDTVDGSEGKFASYVREGRVTEGYHVGHN